MGDTPATNRIRKDVLADWWHLGRQVAKGHLEPTMADEATAATLTLAMRVQELTEKLEVLLPTAGEGI